MKKLLALLAIASLSITLVSCGEVFMQTNVPGVDTGLKIQLFTDDQNTSTTQTTQLTLPIFTLNELAQYTGTNGTAAYVAVNGVVYDATTIFTDGMHQGIQLGGTDATTIFASSPHTMDLLNTLTIVGYLDGSQAAADYHNSLTNTDTATQTTTSATTMTATTTQVQDATIVYLPVFTLSDLALYTGTNGTTAYTAINGVIYDVTNVFTNGMHQGIQIGGIDSTQIFASSPHSNQTLASLTVIGSLEGYPQIADPSASNSSTPITTTQSSGTYDDDDENENESESDDNYEHHDGGSYDSGENEYYDN